MSRAGLPYRNGVGIMLVNGRGRVFVGRRCDMPGAWQMPQGGIDPGESAEAAALRELAEEIGTDKAEILAVTENWLHYDFPDYLAGRFMGGKYRGQSQKWVLARFTGSDEDIDLNGHEEVEFDAWDWVPPERLPALIVAFKRPLYAAVLEAFGPRLPGGDGADES